MLLREYARRGLDNPAVIWQSAHVSFDPETAPSVTSDDLVPHIMSGSITVRPGIERVAGAEIVLGDASRLRPDTLIFCTGYGLDFPFLPPELQPWSDAAVGLYRLVFPPDHPTLAFIGVCRVQGPILPIVEMQARWVAQVLTGKARLPSPTAMRAEIAQRVHRQVARRDALIRVALLPYLDEIGELIGVRLRLWRHPRIVWPVLAGPPVAAQYRLDGPGRWTGAEEVIRAEGSSRRIGVPPS
jgi:dimethylaniline monooxygenase (N-oxide forming)